MKLTKRQKIVFSVFVSVLIIYIVGGGISGYVTSSTCGNDICEDSGENRATCPQDCISNCGNDVCEPGENLTCSMDCSQNTVFSPAINNKVSSDGVVIPAFLAGSIIVLLFYWSDFSKKKSK